MKKVYRYLIRFILWATGIFVIWYFLLQKLYIYLISNFIVLISPIMSFGKVKILELTSISSTFGVYSVKQAFEIDEASIVSGVVFLLASLLASGLKWKIKFKWMGIGWLISFVFHILANVFIIKMYAENNTTVEGFKIFLDGVLLMALPIFIWGFALLIEKKIKFENIFISEGK